MKNVCYNASSHDFVLFAEEASFDNCKKIFHNISYKDYKDLWKLNFREGSIPVDVKWIEEAGVYFIQGNDSMDERSFWSAISGLLHVLTNPSIYPTVSNSFNTFTDRFIICISTNEIIMNSLDGNQVLFLHYNHYFHLISLLL